MWRSPTSDNLLIALFNVNKVDINWWWSWNSHYSFETIVTESKFPCAFLLELQLRKIKQSSTIFPMLHYWPWWRLQMEYFPRNWPFVRRIHWSPVNSPHKGQWRGALMFSLICIRINGWVNNHEAGDLRRYRAHYDVTVMHSDNDTMIPVPGYIYMIRITTSHLQHHIYLWTSLCGSWSYGTTLIVI